MALGERSEPQSRESSINVALVPTLNCHSALILMSYGQSNIILIINKYINYIPVILEFICDISDLNLSKIQLQYKHKNTCAEPRMHMRDDVMFDYVT